MRDLNVFLMAPSGDSAERKLTIQVADDENVGPPLLIQKFREDIVNGHKARYFIRRDFTLYYDEVKSYYIKTEKGRW